LENINEILEAARLPFKMYNKNTLPIDEYVYTLSLRVFNECDINTARKFVSYSIEKDWLIKSNHDLLLNVPLKFKKELKFNLEIDLKFIEHYEMVELPIISTIEPFKPVKKSKIERPVLEEKSIKKLTIEKTPIKKTQKVEKQKITEQLPKKPDITTDDGIRKEDKIIQEKEKEKEPEKKDDSEKKKTKPRKKAKDSKYKTLDAFFKN